jgi:hypothetical protein
MLAMLAAESTRVMPSAPAANTDTRRPVHALHGDATAQQQYDEQQQEQC